MFANLKGGEVDDIPENHPWHYSQAGWDQYYRAGPKQSFLFLIPVGIEAVAFYFLNNDYRIIPFLNVSLYESLLLWIDFALAAAMAANLLLVIFNKTFLSNIIRIVEYSFILYAFFRLMVVFPFDLAKVNLLEFRPWATLFLVACVVYCGLIIIVHIVRLFMGYKD